MLFLEKADGSSVLYGISTLLSRPSRLPSHYATVAKRSDREAKLSHLVPVLQKKVSLLDVAIGCWLDEWFGVRMLVGVRNFSFPQNIQTVSGAHTAFGSTGTGVPSQG